MSGRPASEALPDRENDWASKVILGQGTGVAGPADAAAYLPLTRAAPAAGASTDLGEVGGAQRAKPASTDGWGQPYSNSMRQRTSAPKLPSDEDEMSLTLS